MSKRFKDATSDGFAYLTKRLLVSRAKAAGRIASKEAMLTMGYTVIALDGWIVKKYPDGRIERISPIDMPPLQPIILD